MGRQIAIPRPRRTSPRTWFGVHRPGHDAAPETRRGSRDNDGARSTRDLGEHLSRVVGPHGRPRGLRSAQRGVRTIPSTAGAATAQAWARVKGWVGGMRHKPWSGCGGPGVSAAERPRRAGAWAGLIRVCPTCGFGNDAASTRRHRGAARGARGALGGPGACGSAPERRGRGCPRRTDEVRLAWEELTRVPRLRSAFELEAAAVESAAVETDVRAPAAPRGVCGEIVTHDIDGSPRDRRRGRWRVLGIAAGAIWRRGTEYQFIQRCPGGDSEVHWSAI